MRKKVTVRNKLKEGNNIIIKEGNAGVYRVKANVKSGGKYVLTLDHNATYREYVLITLPDNTTLPAFSSDDLAERKVIEVKERKLKVGAESSSEDKFYWEFDPVEGEEETEEEKEEEKEEVEKKEEKVEKQEVEKKEEVEEKEERKDEGKDGEKPVVLLRGKDEGKNGAHAKRGWFRGLLCG